MLPEPNSPLGPTWRIYPFSHAPFMFRYLPAETQGSSWCAECSDLLVPTGCGSGWKASCPSSMAIG